MTVGVANPGRIAAARALVEVDAGAHAEDVLARVAPRSGPDRALAWFLALGVLERRSHVDAALRPHLRRPIASLDPEVRAVLRMGAFEALYSRTKAHAVVHQAVEVARRVGARRAEGMVNAVLRRVREPSGLSRAEELDHPAWLVARWDARYGADATTAWCAGNNEPSTLHLVARDPGLAERFAAAEITCEPVSLAGLPLPGVYRVPGRTGAVPELPGYDEGAFWVQNAASVAVADSAAPGKGRVLDACAAPGGKTFRMALGGASVVAVDRDADRLQLVADSARRLGLPVEIRTHDWTAGDLGDVTFDAVVVDAPCTALGLLRRHPEIRWRRQLVDIPAAAARQRQILATASRHVRPGGVLVYAVCSPEPEEGDGVVSAFLAANPSFRLDGRLSTAPPQADEDAFFAARLVRAGE